MEENSRGKADGDPAGNKGRDCWQLNWEVEGRGDRENGGALKNGTKRGRIRRSKLGGRGARGRGGGREEEGGKSNNGSKGRIHRQFTRKVRMSRARPTDPSEECARGLCPVSNPSSRAPSRRAVGTSPSKSSEVKQHDETIDAKILQGTGRVPWCSLNLARRHDRRLSVKESLRQKPGIVRRVELVGGMCCGVCSRKDTTRLPTVS